MLCCPRSEALPYAMTLVEGDNPGLRRNRSSTGKTSTRTRGSTRSQELASTLSNGSPAFGAARAATRTSTDDGQTRQRSNLLVPGTEGGVSVHVPTGEQLSIYDTAMKYKAEGTPLIVIAGKEYGTGSSRDWAAKGTMLLGVKAVIAESFERIHRSNLIGMGVLPLQFKDGENAQSLGLTGKESFEIIGLNGGAAKVVTVVALSLIHI